MKNPQYDFFKKTAKSYGGELLKKRKGRLAGGRPLDTKNTMHLVLKSSCAVGEYSFRRHKNKVNSITKRFAVKFGIKLLSTANVGNHLHFQMKLGNRHTYRKFIRATTSAIMMAVTGASRVKKFERKFWDYRPFTRIVHGLRAFLNLKDYVEYNKFEGEGAKREQAIAITKIMKAWQSKIPKPGKDWIEIK